MTRSAVCWPQEGWHRKLEPFDTERFEYAVTEGPRKQDTPPPDGDGWMELDWYRTDFTDEALWRRVKPTETA